MKSCLAVLAVLIAVCLPADEPKDVRSEDRVEPATSEGEARARAKLLHEMANGTLQVMHRDFFDDEDPHAIPSASMEDVFREMQRSFDVEMKWLVVNTDVVNVDHQPDTPFDKVAVKSLAAGEPYAEEVSAERYQYAGPIRLGSQCLKCHVKHRTSNRDRTAGIVISMPLAKKSNEGG